MFYEAIVTDHAPDSEMPGFVKVKIPMLFGDDEVPFLVGPIHPGWTAGGWQAHPNVELPSGMSETDVRLIVVKLGPNTYRYLGTTQGWDLIEATPGMACGARSFDGHHTVVLDENGFRATGFDDAALVQLLEAGARITGAKVTLTSSKDGTTPTEPLMLGRTYLTDLLTFLTSAAADAAMSPGVAAAASTFIPKVAQSLASGGPHLSTVSETE